MSGPAHRVARRIARPARAGSLPALALALGRLEDTLAEAGVDPATYDPGSPPPGLSRTQRGAIERAAAGLLDPRVQEAVAAVDQQARDVCQTPLYQ